MSSLASEMPFYNLNTAEFYNEISNRYDSIFTNCDLKDFIGKIDPNPVFTVRPFFDAEYLRNG